MHTAEYRVRLDAFEGPLDLLLYLIRRAEVEVTEIPVATIADQYMAYMRSEGLQQIDIEKAGEFLVMAATLMEIKSRMLLPAQAATAEGEEGTTGDAGVPKAEDPRAELVRQLLAYKKFRDAAESLQHRLQAWENRYPAQGGGVDRERLGEALSEQAEVDLEELELVDLVEAFARVIETVDLNRVGEHHVTVDDTPTEVHAGDILDRLGREAGEVQFAALFLGRTRGEAIGMFLALLELVRQRKVRVTQDQAEGGITVGLAPAEEATAEQSAMPHSEQVDSGGDRGAEGGGAG